ncbi:RDS1 [Acrasis kona]|uniref:RDS1 n=1 Tax=Acrasis kona TaxID=1008807 RepID=A0AAW2ZCJ2_9EUKA
MSDMIAQEVGGYPTRPFVYLADNICANCKKLHKKCDRQLPECSRCIRRSRQCHYEDKIDCFSSQTVSTSASIIRLDPNKRVKYFTIDLLENCLFEIQFRMPIITCEELKNILMYIDETNEKTKTALKPQRDNLAFVYSVLAVKFKREGNIEQSELLYQNCRNLIMGDNFEYVINNFVTAASFFFLGVYCSLGEDQPRSSFYLSNVEGYVQNVERRGGPYHPCHDILKDGYEIIKLFLQTKTATEAIEKVVGKFCFKIISLKSFYSSEHGRSMVHDKRIAEIFANASFPYTQEQVRGTLTDRENGDYILKNICECHLDCHQKLYDLTKHPCFLGRKLTAHFTYEGMRLYRFILMGDDEKAFVIADSIVRFLLSSDYSKCVFLLIVVDIIIITTEYHIRCIEACTDPVKIKYLLECLRQEQKSLLYLHYRYFRNRTEQILKRLECICENFVLVNQQIAPVKQETSTDPSTKVKTQSDDNNKFESDMFTSFF